MKAIAPGDFTGRYIHYGIREHGMAAAMNGMALHGGVVPYGGTFLVFSDYCRPAIRLAALMGMRVIHVMTHDSIGLGEDGPTHQPVEHLAALRAIPELLVFRPADAVETAECWADGAGREDRAPELHCAKPPEPAYGAHRPIRTKISRAKGAYELAPADGAAQVTLLATGSEVEIALAARAILAAGRHRSRASSRCRAGSSSRAKSEACREEVLGPGTVKIAVEAALPFGWDRYIGPYRAFRRHARLRRQRARQGPLQTFRHHTRGGRKRQKAH